MELRDVLLSLRSHFAFIANWNVPCTEFCIRYRLKLFHPAFFSCIVIEMHSEEDEKMGVYSENESRCGHKKSNHTLV